MLSDVPVLLFRGGKGDRLSFSGPSWGWVGKVILSRSCLGGGGKGSDSLPPPTKP